MMVLFERKMVFGLPSTPGDGRTLACCYTMFFVKGSGCFGFPLLLLMGPMVTLNLGHCLGRADLWSYGSVFVQ